MATFCLEQLGRYEIYRENANRAAEGTQVTARSMARDLADHLPKLYRAQIPVTATIAGFLSSPPEPGSEELRQLGEQLTTVRRRLEADAPRKALQDRKLALHVDRIQYAPGWNRPVDSITHNDADYYVGAANLRYDTLRRALEKDGSEIGRMIGARVEYLRLPEPPWDVWTWELDATQQTADHL